MADIIVDGKTRISFVPAGNISNIFAPTVAQLNAGTLLQVRLIPAGIEGFDPSQAEIDNTSLASKTDSKMGGRSSYSGTRLIFKKETSTDPVYQLLKTQGTIGHVAIRDAIDEATAWTIGQECEVYPVELGRCYKTGRGEANSLLRFVVPIFITADPATQALVA